MIKYTWKDIIRVKRKQKKMIKCTCGFKRESESEMMEHVKKMMEAGAVDHIPVIEAELPKGLSFYQ